MSHPDRSLLGWDTHCKKGHPRTLENTWRNGSGGAACKPCIVASRKVKAMDLVSRGMAMLVSEVKR